MKEYICRIYTFNEKRDRKFNTMTTWRFALKRRYHIWCTRHVSWLTFIRYAQNQKIVKPYLLFIYYKVFEDNTTKGPKQDNQNRLRSLYQKEENLSYMLFDIKHTKYCYLNSTLWKIEYIYCLRIFCRFEIQMAGAA
jgi:hypothetical protein